MKSVSLGNSRFLYCKQKPDKVDLNQAVALVDLYVSQNRQVELVCDKIIVYLRSDEVWIGREVAGFPPQLPEGIFMQDFEATRVFQTQLAQTSMFFQELARQAAELGSKEGKEIYRLVFDLERFDAPIAQFGATSK